MTPTTSTLDSVSRQTAETFAGLFPKWGIVPTRYNYLANDHELAGCLIGALIVEGSGGVAAGIAAQQAEFGSINVAARINGLHVAYVDGLSCGFSDGWHHDAYRDNPDPLFHAGWEIGCTVFDLVSHQPSEQP